MRLIEPVGFWAYSDDIGIGVKDNARNHYWAKGADFSGCARVRFACQDRHAEPDAASCPDCRRVFERELGRAA